MLPEPPHCWRLNLWSALALAGGSLVSLHVHCTFQEYASERMDFENRAQISMLHTFVKGVHCEQRPHIS